MNIKDLLYIFKFKSTLEYKILYIYSIVRKILGKFFFGTFNSSYIKTNTDYLIENSNGKYKIYEPSDMHAILKPHNEEEIESFFKLNGGIFLDIGGNVGKYSVLIGKQSEYNKIFTFEPNTYIYKNYLSENIKLNNLSNVTLINEGLADKIGTLKLNIPDGNNFGSASLIDHKDLKTNKVNIKVNTLDNFIQEMNIDILSIKLIKIDVEGFELNVLRGALKTLSLLKNTRIIIEISKDQSEINNILSKYSFNNIFHSGINYIYEK